MWILACGASPAFYFLKLFIIILPDGTHHPVPEQKVQTIISLKVLVVLVVIDGSVDPFTQPVLAESFWV